MQTYTTLNAVPFYNTVKIANKNLPKNGDITVNSMRLNENNEVELVVTCNANTNEPGRAYCVTLYKHYVWKADYFTIN